jgi:multidrug transporter EmrE-like cation transporter
LAQIEVGIAYSVLGGTGTAIVFPLESYSLESCDSVKAFVLVNDHGVVGLFAE